MWKNISTRNMQQSYVTRRTHTWHDALMCVMTHSYVTWRIHMWHDAIICETTYRHGTCNLVRDMTYSYVSHSYVTWCNHMRNDIFTWNMQQSYVIVRDTTHSCVTWRVHMWHDAFVCDMMQPHVKRHVHETTYPNDVCDAVCCSALLCVTLHETTHPNDVSMEHATTVRDMTHSYVTRPIHIRHDWLIPTWHDVFVSDTTYSWVTWRIHMRYAVAFLVGTYYILQHALQHTKSRCNTYYITHSHGMWCGMNQWHVKRHSSLTEWSHVWNDLW